jgi:hypothetical protein
MSAPNVLGYALAAVAQWVVVQTGRRGWAWLAWMIRSKDSLFSHCWLTRRAQANRRASPLPPPFPLFRCTGHSAMSSALCLLGGGDGCVGCVACVWEEMRARTRPLCLPSLLEFPPPFSHPLFNYPSTYPTHLLLPPPCPSYQLRVPLYTCCTASPVKSSHCVAPPFTFHQHHTLLLRKLPLTTPALRPCGLTLQCEQRPYTTPRSFNRLALLVAARRAVSSIQTKSPADPSAASAGG